MAERAAYYTLHSQLTGLVLFKEKRRTQCRICQKGEWDMTQDKTKTVIKQEDRAEAEEFTMFLQSLSLDKKALMNAYIEGMKAGVCMVAKKPA